LISWIFDLTSCFQDGDHASFHAEKCFHLVSEHKVYRAPMQQRAPVPDL